MDVWDVDPNKASKCDVVDCWVFNRFGCFISNCCAKLVDDGCPIGVHCFPPPIDPSNDDELEGTVETPPLLLTCK